MFKWVVKDVPRTEGVTADPHRTEWCSTWRGHTLVILRSHGKFETWVESPDSNSEVGFRVSGHTKGLSTLSDAKERVAETAVGVLNRRALTDQETDAMRLMLLVDLEHAYRTAAQRAVGYGLFGEELAYMRLAADMKAEADEIRTRVARVLAAKSKG